MNKINPTNKEENVESSITFSRDKILFMACFVIYYKLLPVRCKRLISGYQAPKSITILLIASVNHF